MRTLKAIFEALNFVQRRRERIRAEREAERQHQLAMFDKVIVMFETLADGQSRTAEQQSAALIEIAKANAAQAETFATWLKSFHTVETPTSSVITDEDEFYAEQQRMFEDAGIPTADLPPEFQLALRLQKGISDIGASAPS